MRTGVSVWLLSLFLLVLAPGIAQAQYDDDWRNPNQYEAQPLDRILPQIRRDHPGRFYDAEGPFMGSDGQMHYRVKWMTPDGRVVWFDADARTGRVLGSGGGRHDFANGGGPYDRPQDGGRGNYYGGGQGNWNGGQQGNRGNWNGGGRGNWNGGGKGNGGGGRRWGGGFWGGRGGNRHGGH
jgi:hypothetical protein